MTNNPFTYQFPPGGDITLECADGATFLAHSVLLGLASPVLADMIFAAQESKIILSDDAGPMSLMLRFIYPPAFLQLLPIPQLEESPRVAQRYDVQGIKNAVDHITAFQAQGHESLARSNPVQMFSIAATYGLPNTQKTTQKVLQCEDFEFTTSDIKALAEYFPNAATVIWALGTRCILVHALRGLLLGASVFRHMSFRWEVI
ncbi:The BTB (BR-C, ttk and bab)/POZ (Pox virus and Zinc finger) domain [Ceratobasidium sp. AG-Ba]|nr:The BTB (BR-C, ttk and bab)/POZ (Pox virus and Zinc finger) domain [Ceratobasidium sp. AG-Ba]